MADPPPPGHQQDAAFARLLTGSAPGEMALSDTAARAAELRRSLEELATVLTHRPDALTWPIVLDKLAVAAAAAAGLRARLRPLARAYGAHPAPGSGLDPGTAAAVLPGLLSSRRLPDQEAAAAKAVEAACDAAGIDAATAQPGDLAAALAVRVDQLNAVVDGLLGGGGGGGDLPASARGALDPRGPRRRAWAADLHAAAAAAATAAAALAAPARGVPGSRAAAAGAAAATAPAAGPRPPPTPAAVLATAALEGRLP